MHSLYPLEPGECESVDDAARARTLKCCFHWSQHTKQEKNKWLSIFQIPLPLMEGNWEESLFCRFPVLCDWRGIRKGSYEAED